MLVSLRKYLSAGIACSLVVIVLGGCSAIAVTCDYDKKTNFTKYKTYVFSEDLNGLSLQKSDKESILRAVDIQMEFRGYRSFYTERPDTIDLLIDIQTKKSLVNRTLVAAAQSDKLYTPWGYEFTPNFTASRIDLDKYEDDALFISIIENRQQKIIWQGRGTKVFEDLPMAEREANINYSIGMIFRSYPVPSSR